MHLGYAKMFYWVYSQVINEVIILLVTYRWKYHKEDNSHFIEMCLTKQMLIMYMYFHYTTDFF